MATRDGEKGVNGAGNGVENNVVQNSNKDQSASYERSAQQQRSLSCSVELSAAGLSTQATTAANTTTTTATSSMPSMIVTTALPNKAEGGKRARIYRGGMARSKWVTREIAALDFLLNIPLQAEQRIVHAGWLMKQQQEKDEQQNMNADADGGDDTHHRHLENKEEEILEPPVATVSPAARAATMDNSAASNTNKGNRWWEKFNHPVPPAQQQQPTTKEQLQQQHEQQAQEAATAAISGPKSSATNNPPPSAAVYNMVNNAVRRPAARRLEGQEAIQLKIPLNRNNNNNHLSNTTNTYPIMTQQKSIARAAALREWELQTAHGFQNARHPPAMDGRLFFSAASSYPVSVFSMIRYEPKKEEMALRRQKLEARGGGGTQFVMPARDWRGISYRALLQNNSNKRSRNQSLRAFNRFLRRNATTTAGGEETAANESSKDDASSTSSDSSDDDQQQQDEAEVEEDYVPGVLDDPGMVLGKNRNVMRGDKNTGPMVSSTIQFVKPALLKAELNKQFRERFDGWEPPQHQRKFIGARVVNGVYTLMDPTITTDESFDEENEQHQQPRRGRKGSVDSEGGINSRRESTTTAPTEIQLRMPPSLTLSKIRSLKQQALAAAVDAKLQVGTVALACVYFERLCLDCRVDKSNRRISFAACLLLASKLNEPNIGLVIKKEDSSKDANDSNAHIATRIQSLIRPNKTSSNALASLLEFFTQDWSLSLKRLFDAEWGVFAALGFSLHAKPSQVDFHFKRLMKTLEWKPKTYLGAEMYNRWQEALAVEEERRKEKERREEERRRRKEERILNRQMELEKEVMRNNRKANLHDLPTSTASNDKESISKVKDIEKEEAGRHRPRTPKSTIRPGAFLSASIPVTLSPTREKIASKKNKITLLHRLGMRRTESHSRFVATNNNNEEIGSTTDHNVAYPRRKSGSFLTASPSMPIMPTASLHLPTTDHDNIAINIPESNDREWDANSIASLTGSDKGIIV